MEDYKKNLKEYIQTDVVYKDFMEHKNKNFNDFEMFCVDHCEDIKKLLEENARLEAELKLKEGTLHTNHVLIHGLNDLEDYLNEEIGKLQTSLFPQDIVTTERVYMRLKTLQEIAKKVEEINKEMGQI